MIRTFLIIMTFAVAAVDAFGQQPENVVPTPRPLSQEVVDYVRNQPLPRNPVQVTELITAGSRLPNNLELSPIPDAHQYGFIVVNQDRLIVDSATRTVVKIVD
ncbi:DUF1236 domain-containing protein [Neorhizobium sp. DT-125]|uniref:DUF1236 domain-containing protein n=1 Tax=Neorhizobium sp. DT-125 TaxID=3396163 RepID=UPI003F1E1766